MQQGDDKRGGNKPASRQERLEAELRENLRKRKEQARARARSTEAADQPKPERAGETE